MTRSVRSSAVVVGQNDPMHDDRDLVEERITRELHERVLPLVHADRRPLTVEAGASLDGLAPFDVGERWGAPWATTWFRFSGEVPTAWSGRRVEALLDLGFRLDAPGFQCEGLVRDAKGRPVQGVHPRRQAVPVTTGPGPVELVVEAASNPTFPSSVPRRWGRRTRRVTRPCTASTAPNWCSSTPRPKRSSTTSMCSTG